MPCFNGYSRDATQDAFLTLPRYFSQNRWLGKNNRYLTKCVQKIRDDVKSGVIQKTVPSQNGVHFHLAQYVAASVPHHCLDGWTLLGKALSCAAMGDMNAAKHFGYYAELRAVMAMLGAEGIGIFQNHHFTLNDIGGRKPLVTCIGLNGTHEAVSTGLKEWAQSTNSGDLLAKIIRPEGFTLEDWFSTFTNGLSHPWSNIGEQWLNQWGYDIQALKNDKTAREEASYRPFINNKNKISKLKQTVNIIVNIWEQSELGINYSFRVDLYLLRRSFATFKVNSGMSNSDFRARIKNTLSQLGFSGLKHTQLYRMLIKSPTQKNDPLILVEADKTGLDSPNYHMQLLARATLLLRLATGASNQLLQKSGVNQTHIEFWWKTIGEQRGLWEKVQIDPLINMWSDVQTSLVKIKTSPSPSSYAEWRLDFSQEILSLSGCERIALSRLCL